MHLQKDFAQATDQNNMQELKFIPLSPFSVFFFFFSRTAAAIFWTRWMYIQEVDQCPNQLYSWGQLTKA